MVGGWRQHQPALWPQIKGQFFHIKNGFPAFVTAPQHHAFHRQRLRNGIGQIQHPPPAGQVETHPFDLAVKRHGRCHRALQRKREGAKRAQFVIHGRKGDRRYIGKIGRQVEPLQGGLVNAGHIDFGLPAIHVQFQIDLALDPFLVAPKADMGRGRHPGFAQQLILKRDFRADDFNPGQVTHDVIRIGSGLKLGQNPFGEIRRFGFRVHEYDIEPAAEFPPDQQPGTEQFNALRRQQPSNQGLAAQ